jgi:hypothetical protein
VPKETERKPAGETDEKESTMEQKNTKRSYRLFVGVDIAYRDFTASLVQEAKTTREPHPYPQTAPGFERFQKR